MFIELRNLQKTRGEFPTPFQMLQRLVGLAAAATALSCSSSVARAEDELCDMTVPSSVCLFGGQKVLLPDASPAGLSGRWTFDEIKPVDSSGNMHHASFTVGAGPGVMGRGSSGAFTGFNTLRIPDPDGDLLSSAEDGNFGLSFWVYLPQNPVELQEGHASAGDKLMCSLVTKGEDAEKPAVSVMMSPKTRRLEVRVVTKEDGHEAFRSTGKVRTNAWVHVALLRVKRESSASDLTLFLNGVQDMAESTKFGASVPNSEPLVVGSPRSEETKGSCHVMMYVDELKTYAADFDVTTFSEFVAAEASPALAGIDPGFARCGCVNCTSTVAASSSCGKGYRLCNEMELAMGGYQIGRANGCIDYKTKKVWTPKDLEKSPTSGHGAGMCCRAQW